MKLLISGGSHRAGLGGAGAVGYFCWAEAVDLAPDDRGRRDRWSSIDEMVSVSGGSILTATLAAHGSATIDDTCRAIGGMIERLLADGMRPHATARRVAVAAAAVVVTACLTWMVLAAVGLVGPDAIGDSPWAFVIGLAVLPIGLFAARRLATAYLRDISNVIVGAHDVPIDAAPPSPRRFLIAASGLSSGVPYYLASGRIEHPTTPTWGTVIDSGYTLGEAAVASGSLPGLGGVRAPDAYRREVLVDGGVSGSFGEQVSASYARRPEDTWRFDGDWFAIDAVRHLTADRPVGRWLRSLSLTAAVFRWIRVSIEATYVNDLIDLGPGQFARVWKPNEPGPGVGKAPADLRSRLAVLQQQVESLSLTGLRRELACAAVVAGFLSTMEVRRGLRVEEIDGALAWLDDRFSMGGQIVAAWGDTAQPSASIDSGASHVAKRDRS